MVIICGVHVDEDVEYEEKCTRKVDDLVILVVDEVIADLVERKRQRNGKRVEDGDQKNDTVPPKLLPVVRADKELA